MSTLRKTALLSAIVCLALGALFAIAVVLFGDFSDFEIKVLLSALTAGFSAVCVFASLGYRHPVLGGKIGYVAIGIQLVGAIMLLVGIWGERWFDEPHWKITWIFITCGMAMAHILALFCARLRPSWKWIQIVAGVVIFLLGAMLSFMIAGELYFEDFMFRGIAVLAILAILASLVIPILHLISKSERKGSGALVLVPLGENLYRDRAGREYRVEEVEPPPRRNRES